MGGLIYLSNTHFYKFKANVGRGTNNFRKFMALKFMLKLTLDLGVNQLQIFGDSTLDTSWTNGQVQLQNIQLLPLTISLREIKVHFETIIFTHVFHELNFVVDVLSKEGLHSPVGQVIL